MMVIEHVLLMVFGLKLQLTLRLDKCVNQAEWAIKIANVQKLDG